MKWEEIERCNIVLKPMDHVLVYGRSWVSFGIRLAAQHPGEGPTMFNHAAFMVDHGMLHESTFRGVKSDLLLNRYKNDKHEVLIVRRNDMSTSDALDMVRYSKKKLGRKYGVLKIPLHFLDWIIATHTGKPVTFLRRLCLVGDTPICSGYLEETLRYRKYGLRPDVPANALQPDDYGDDVFMWRPDIYDIVFFTDGIPELAERSCKPFKRKQIRRRLASAKKPLTAGGL